VARKRVFGDNDDMEPGYGADVVGTYPKRGNVDGDEDQYTALRMARGARNSREFLGMIDDMEDPDGFAFT